MMTGTLLAVEPQQQDRKSVPAAFAGGPADSVGDAWPRWHRAPFAPRHAWPWPQGGLPMPPR